MNNNTAILIFANSAQTESARKSFSKSEVLFDELNRQTLAKVKKSGLPYFLSSEKEQQGKNFGERYVNAIQSVYDKGFENVITVGNDTPHLQTAQLLKTAKTLEKNPIVLGPSLDGGYYLMGLHKSQFNSEIFLKLPWQTSRLTVSITRLLSAKKIKVFFLKRLRDIDEVVDAKKILHSFKDFSKAIRNILLAIFSSEKRIYNTTPILVSSVTKETHYNKGSPNTLHL
ncbi:DUF2064 domain-containing protein [Patiriisocius hiemis]|uniref:DUF2064 domain-containing protein n=1 Tax=Patiriisocius hiemis TaxID=3075604 RepID=A0ABU2YDM4_9FLAO|nr:DUF2064 domain-containing protein [Constantimarinum sp. W242]MDT0556280.1 DUF2064 domain-containing protein [Constantimarinum sp. W242]